MNTQPEALGLADCIDPPQIFVSPAMRAAAAAELRRLHEVNQKLAESNVELLEALKEIAKPIEGSAIGNPWDFYYDLQIFAEHAIARCKATN